MGFFGTIFGTSDEVELKESNKALVKRVKQLESEITEQREKDDDDYHEIYRENYLKQRKQDESQEDFEHRMERSSNKSEVRNQDAIEEAKRLARNESKVALSKKEEEVAELKSQIRDLELAAEEEQQETDLAIQEGILEYKEAHLEDVSKLQVKVATLEGEVKAAQADGKSKDQVIKILTDLLEDYGETNSQLVETISEVAPKINLEKIGFEVTVPVPAKQGGGEQKKDGNK